MPSIFPRHRKEARGWAPSSPEYRLYEVAGDAFKGYSTSSGFPINHVVNKRLV